MHTLPQINLYTHGTQWTASHGHLAFFGAYATIIIAVIYIALQSWRGDVWMARPCRQRLEMEVVPRPAELGVLGMTVALLISGYEQSFIERALGGSTWAAYFAARSSHGSSRACTGECYSAS